MQRIAPSENQFSSSVYRMFTVLGFTCKHITYLLCCHVTENLKLWIDAVFGGFN